MNFIKQKYITIFFCTLSLLLFSSVATYLIAQNKQVDLEFQTEHTKLISSIDFSSDRKYAATGSRDRTIKVWDLRSKKLIKTFRGHQREVSVVKFTKDGQYLFSGESGVVTGPIYTLKKWNFLTGEEIYTKNKIKGSIKNISISPDNKYVLLEISGALWTIYQIRSVETGELDKKLTNLLRVHANLKGLKAGQSGILVDNPSDLEPKEKMEDKIIWGVDNKSLALYNKDKAIVWQFKEGEESLKSIIIPKYDIATFAFGAQETAVTGSFNGKLDLWKISKNTGKSYIIREMKGHQNSLININYDENNKWIISKSNDGWIYTWTREGLVQDSVQDKHAINIYEPFTQDANILISASTNGDVTLWDREKGKIRTFNTDSIPVTKLIPNYYSSDSLLITYNYQRRKPIQFWDLQEVNSKKVKKNKVKKAQLKNKEKGNKYKIETKIRNRKKSRVKARPESNKLKIKLGKDDFFNKTIPFALHPEGKSIASIGAKGIIIKDLKTKHTIAQVGKGEKLYIDLTYSFDGTELLAFDINGYLTAWQIDNGHQLTSTPLVKATNWVTIFNSQLVLH